jgi:hypothetical protein
MFIMLYYIIPGGIILKQMQVLLMEHSTRMIAIMRTMKANDVGIFFVETSYYAEVHLSQIVSNTTCSNTTS